MRLSDERTARIATLLKLASGALKRRPVPNLPLADGAVDEVLHELLGDADAPEQAPSALRGDKYKVAAAALGYSEKHTRYLAKSGALGDAVIGSGRGTRIIVSRAIEALSAKGKRTAPKVASELDEIAAAGAAWAAKGAHLRVVNGGE